MKKIVLIFGLLCGFATTASWAQGPHIVFVIGDEEYRSEESMPMLARILQRELKARITLCFPVDSAGNINPNVNNNIAGLEALETADLMVAYLRWRKLPAAQLKYITDYVEKGKPVVGFRTSTHSFLYENNPELAYLNNEWPASLWGQQWIVHHGHFDDGKNPLTAVSLRAGTKSPILRGVKPFLAYSWLYHVDGGKWKLQGDYSVLLDGKSLKSKHEMEGKLVEYPLNQPVAWTKTYASKSGKKGRVFFTTLGHPFDFLDENMRKLAVQGIYWALGKENQIPYQGIKVHWEGTYQPNNSGFGQKYKQQMKAYQILKN